MHNFFLTRADVTTSAERFFGQKPPRSMFVAILDSSSYRQLPSVRCDEPWARLKGIATKLILFPKYMKYHLLGHACT